MTQAVSNRSLTLVAQGATPKAPAAQGATPSPQAAGDRLQLGRPVAKAPEAQGSIKRYNVIAGTVGGGVTGAVVGLFGALLGFSRGHAGLMIGGATAVGAALGFGIGKVQGTVAEKVAEQAGENSAKQWSLYLAAGGVFSGLQAMREASAIGRGAHGIGALLTGGGMLFAETQAMKNEKKAGGKLQDNQIRVAGAAGATLGGAAMLAAAFPFAAAVATPLAIVGGVAAAVGFGAVVVGRLMDDKK